MSKTRSSIVIQLFQYKYVTCLLMSRKISRSMPFITFMRERDGFGSIQTHIGILGLVCLNLFCSKLRFAALQRNNIGQQGISNYTAMIQFILDNACEIDLCLIFAYSSPRPCKNSWRPVSRCWTNKQTNFHIIIITQTIYNNYNKTIFF